MRFSDDENGMGVTPDVPSAPPAEDFGRRRVERILKRERPRNEQNDDTHWDGNFIMERMLCRHPHSFVGQWSWLGDGPRFEVYCMWRRATISAGAGGTRWRVCYDLKKAGAANLNSRFLGRPF
jgi:hypothetical protein